jgi:hypothetical protein
MKFEIDESLEIIIKEFFETASVPYTLENRDKMLNIAFNVGISTILHSFGLTEAIRHKFEGFTEPVIKEDDDAEEEPDTPNEQYAPDKCGECGKRVLFNGKTWTCNCRTYEKSPKPDAICKHCHEVVKPFHYYWQCSCNRYLVPPDEPIELTQPGESPLEKLPVWSSSFPQG